MWRYCPIWRAAPRRMRCDGRIPPGNLLAKAKVRWLTYESVHIKYPEPMTSGRQSISVASIFLSEDTLQFSKRGPTGACKSGLGARSSLHVRQLTKIIKKVPSYNHSKIAHRFPIEQEQIGRIFGFNCLYSQNSITNCPEHQCTIDVSRVYPST